MHCLEQKSTRIHAQHLDPTLPDMFSRLLVKRCPPNGCFTYKTAVTDFCLFRVRLATHSAKLPLRLHMECHPTKQAELLPAARQPRGPSDILQWGTPAWRQGGGGDRIGASVAADVAAQSAQMPGSKVPAVYEGGNAPKQPVLMLTRGEASANHFHHGGRRRSSV